MQFFDFKKNWDEFYKHLHSPKIIIALNREGLTHPLWKHARADGMHQIIMDMANDTMHELQENGMKFREDDDEDDSDYNVLFNYYFDKYSTLDYIHSNIPSGRAHELAPVLFKIAKKMFPNKRWKLIIGDNHSTVVCEEENILFDLLLWFHADRGHGFNKTAQEIYENVTGKIKTAQKDRYLFNTDIMTRSYPKKR